MTTITTVIDPPLPTDTTAVFNTKAFKAWGDINTWAGQANTVAGEVNTKASTASTAATTATTQAGIATSASATAVSSKNEAVAARNEAVTLTEKYQGASASDPALDKTGNPLTDGDWYVNTVTGFIRAYTVAGGWVNGVTAIAGVSSVNGMVGDVSVIPHQFNFSQGVI